MDDENKVNVIVQSKMKEKEGREDPFNEGTSSKISQSKMLDSRAYQRTNMGQKKIEDDAVPSSNAERFKDNNQQKAAPLPKNNDYKRLSRQDNSSKYANLFNEYCFSCTNFGYMARNCKTYDMYTYQGHYQNHRSKVGGMQNK